MIPFTTINDRSIYIRPDAVDYIIADGKGRTGIAIGSEIFWVANPIRDVIAMFNPEANQK